jgi:hypothetical protein
MHTYIRPEVIITQGRGWEDVFFSHGLEFHSRESRTPHIALSTASRDLMWIASLDSAALRGQTCYHDCYVVFGYTDTLRNSVE